MSCILKITKPCWKNLKKTKINGKTFHVHGLEDETLLHCQYCSKLCKDLVQVPPKFQKCFS